MERESDREREREGERERESEGDRLMNFQKIRWRN